MTYCYKCEACGATAESGRADLAPTRFGACDRCGGRFIRDYRAEAVGLGAGVRVSRDGTDYERAQLFLPSNADLATPEDPTGRKGAADWLERFQPETSRTKNPLLETEKVSF